MTATLHLPFLDNIRGPHFFTGAFMTLLQQHFSTPEQLFDTTLSQMLWAPTNKHDQTTASKIYIDNQLQPQPTKSNFRPAILIQRQEWQRQKIGINDSMSLGQGIGGGKIDRWAGKHNFNCLAREIPAAESLAKEVASFFEVYTYEITELLCLNNDFSVDSIDALKLLEEDKETFSVTVKISYSLLNNWMMVSERLPIRHVFLDVSQEGIDQLISNTYK